MQKVCEQNIKVMSINVTKRQSWAVRELGVAEGTFLSPYSTPRFPFLARRRWLPCHRVPWGCKTPFSLNFSIPVLPGAGGLCLLVAGTAAGEAPALPVSGWDRAQRSGTSCQRQLSHPVIYCGLLGLLGF